MEAFLTSAALVALAEIGDKTQLLSFVLAARLRKPWAIVAGIFVGADAMSRGVGVPNYIADVIVAASLLAMRRAPKGVNIKSEVSDTGTSPDVAVNALERVISRDKPTAVVASMLGTQMLAMLPVALENKVPLITVSGTAQITEMNNPYVFRFFPGDDVTKVAHVKYAVVE